VLLDRSHRNWALFSLISLIAATISWIISLGSSTAGPSGGSFSGLVFGIIGTAMMLFAGLLGGRRALRHLPLGSARFWMKGHLWLGTLCIPFILFHSNFSWGGLLEQALWYSLACVAISGFFGLAVHQFLPGLLWKSVPLETFEPQAPWLCDRLTFLSDVRLSAICERQLSAPSPHLRDSAERTVDAYHRLMNGEGARGEKNARKLLLLQEISPPAVRDFFWAMAKISKSELKAVGFEGDFPELLARIYSELPQGAQEPGKTAASSGSANGPVTASQNNPENHAAVGKAAAAPPALPSVRVAEVGTPPPPASPPAAAVKLSPIEIMRQKAAEKAAAAAGGATAATPTLPSVTADGTVEPPPPASPPAAAVKLSPIEIMRQKAAEKAAAAAGGATAATPALSSVTADGAAESSPPASPPAAAVKLSPIEIMRQKAAEIAAEKAAAAAGGATAAPPALPSVTADGTVEPSPPASPPAAAVKLSPIEIMRQKAAEKAAEKAAAAAGGATAATPTLPSVTADGAVEPSPPASPPAAAVKLSPIEIMRQKAAEKAAAASEAPALPSIPVDAATATATAASASKPTNVIPLQTPAFSSAGSKQPSSEATQRRTVSSDEKRVLWDFYVNSVRPYLMEQGSGGAVRGSAFGSEIDSHRVFHEQECLLPRMLHGVLQELRQAVEVRRQLERQRRLLRWMHWWLMLHVPVSVLLLVFLAAHVVMALRVVPWQF